MKHLNTSGGGYKLEEPLLVLPRLVKLNMQHHITQKFHSQAVYSDAGVCIVGDVHMNIHASV